MSASKRLKEARKYIGITQQQLADKLGLKQTQIKDIEIERQKVSVEIAQKMEIFYTISGWWLLTGQGEMIKKEAAESLAEDEKKMIESYRKLQPERREWYFFKIVAESMD